MKVAINQVETQQAVVDLLDAFVEDFQSCCNYYRRIKIQAESKIRLAFRITVALLG